MAAVKRERRRGRPVVATNSSIGSGIEVPPRELDIAHLRSFHQRREATALLGVDVGAGVEQ